MPAHFVSEPHSAPPIHPVPCTRRQMREIHMLLASMLRYPEDQLADAISAYDDVAATLPPGVCTHFEAFISWAQALSKRDICAHYVDTFDQNRRCALYLSYYMAGDTRLRGSAILGFRDFIHALGYQADGEELDDYLPVILELSAVSGDPLVWELLASHREGIEVMRAALARARSPYRHLLDALASTLPEVSEQTRARFHRLVSEGPPSEMVGVTTLSAAPLPLQHEPAPHPAQEPLNTWSHS